MRARNKFHGPFTICMKLMSRSGGSNPASSSRSDPKRTGVKLMHGSFEPIRAASGKLFKKRHLQNFSKTTARVRELHCGKLTIHFIYSLTLVLCQIIVFVNILAKFLEKSLLSYCDFPTQRMASNTIVGNYFSFEDFALYTHFIRALYTNSILALYNAPSITHPLYAPSVTCPL